MTMASTSGISRKTPTRMRLGTTNIQPARLIPRLRDDAGRAGDMSAAPPAPSATGRTLPGLATDPPHDRSAFVTNTAALSRTQRLADTRGDAGQRVRRGFAVEGQFQLVLQHGVDGGKTRHRRFPD